MSVNKKGEKIGGWGNCTWTFKGDNEIDLVCMKVRKIVTGLPSIFWQDVLISVCTFLPQTQETSYCS